MPESSHKHTPKVVAFRPGLATVRCIGCGKVSLVECQTRVDYDNLVATTQLLRRPRRAVFGE
jgi:hypothetical protein